MENNQMVQMVQKIEDIDIIDSAEKCFLNYSMSVIGGRALPDVRDGLKPVHRRILFAQHELSNRPNLPYKKCARIVGDVIGKYHPHGDSSIYDALVRMAQDFSMRVELEDGQGNFGSVDGDSPAAMRYTEIRMSQFANSMFEDLPFNTINMVPNYDATEFMPEVLPLKYPNLLVNGSEGIAVGMACNVPPHNPLEVMNCLNYMVNCYLRKEEADISELIKLMPAPDFPTGGLAHNLKDMEDVWTTGRGSLRLRAKYFEEESASGNPVIVINEIPYQVNKAKLITTIEELVKPNKEKGGKVEIEEIKTFRDESDKDGMRIYIELKKDCDVELFFNKLISMTMLDLSINYNINVLVNGQPKLIGMKEVFEQFIKHRVSIINRRTQFFDLAASKKQHILAGFVKALTHIDRVIEIIKASNKTSDAKTNLQEFLNIDEAQSQSIIEMRLHKLTSGETSEIEMELKDISAKRIEYKELLESEDKVYEKILEESHKQASMFISAKRKGERVYGKRLTEFEYNRLDTDLAALTKEEDCTILFTNGGYLRRVPVSDFENQNRGTRGKKFMKLKEKDFIVNSINCHSHSVLMMVTEKGKVYSIYAYELKDNLSGRHINNILKMDKGDKVLVMLPVDYLSEINGEETELDIVMVTESGMVKKTKLAEYSNSFRRSGLLGIKLKEDDRIISAEVCSLKDKIMLVNDRNNIIIFEAEKLANLKRKTQGVKGMSIEEGKLIGAGVISQDGLIVTVSCNGMIKITNASEYKTQKRGGKGVKIFKSNDKTGMLFKAIPVSDLKQDIISTTKNGISNRISLEDINITRRTTSGVKLIKLDNKDSLADSFIVAKSEFTENFEDEIEVKESFEEYNEKLTRKREAKSEDLENIESSDEEFLEEEFIDEEDLDSANNSSEEDDE